ncbi:MAG: response regulator [Elusimicrobia bacterium]|nr:response regulator [Elusimicrobiota bacterium]
MYKEKILIVEDDLAAKSSIANALRQEGYAVDDADYGEQALEIIKSNNYDLVLTDLVMGQKNGLDIVREVHRVMPSCKTMIITAYGTIETNMEAIKLGVTDYILKPINIDRLIHKIKACLNRRSLLKHNESLEKKISTFEMTRDIASTLMMSTLVNIILNSACEVLNADGGTLLLSEGSGLVIKAVTRNFRNSIMGTRVGTGKGIIGEVFRTGNPQIINKRAGRNPCFNGFIKEQKIGSAISIPIIDNGGTLGILNLVRKESSPAFTGEDISISKIFSGTIAYAIKNARVYEELKTAYDRQKSMQYQLIKAEKLSAVGRVSSSVAHELNNPLVSVLVNAELLLEEIPKNKPWHEDIKDIQLAAKKCKDIINDLLKISRDKEYKFDEIRINQVIERSLRLSRHTISGSGVTVKRITGKDLPPVSISASHIEQVFTNIIANALHAMPDGGTLTIKTYTKTASEALRRKADRERFKDNVVITEFSDTGAGIRRKDLPNIFEPFFTTKAVGKGTGLGLFVCQGIIEKHGGLIIIKSAGINKGTRVYVYLPVADA